MILTEENYLQHYGILRKSGRYPWGSGRTESIRNKTFLDVVDDLKRKGMTDAEIARGFSTPEFPMSSTQLIAARSIAVNQQRQERIAQAERLQAKGWGTSAIGRRMGINESSVRSLLAPGAKDRANLLQSTASMLKNQVNEKKYIDVSVGVENNIGITNSRLKTAVAMLQEQGYTVHYIKTPQIFGGEQTTIKVLAKPGVSFSEVSRNRAQIKLVTDFSEDGGRSYLGIQPPLSVSSKRLAVRYAEDGGKDADGVIYVRPGVKDVSMGANHYSQVRIAVDGTHYLKGMAVYKDDLPDGVDLLFNTSKSNTGRKLDALKPMKDDPDNPFGAIIRQRIDPHTKKVTSALNIVGAKEGAGEEGGWDTWSKSLASQVLSKQDPKLAKMQLDMLHERKANELDQIMSLTNPSVRRRLLKAYSDSCDSAAVHLKAAALPGQVSRVILPIKSIKPNEVYSPNFRDGERVVLIRYPHGGKFEIPELTVNNRNQEARKLLGTGVKMDAIGIHHSVADRLSGADFDGDTVLVIPNKRGLIKTEAALEGLKNFDPRTSHPPYDGMRTISGTVWDAKQNKEVVPKGGHPYNAKQKEMGKVTNLITDMTIHGASNEELARAIRHSMVVIDAEKHCLDYKGSAAANGIGQLKAKYQGIPTGAKFPERAGASTLISLAGSEYRVPDRKPRSARKGGPIDPVTGQKVWEETGATYVNKKGQVVLKTRKSTRLAETKNAYDLSSGTKIESVYAEHSNKLKALGNSARKELVTIRSPLYSSSAKNAYSKEVHSLNEKLNNALKNAPLERQAQLLAGAWVKQKRDANPDLDEDDLNKIRIQALNEARRRTGAGKHRIVPTQDEWNAIQAGAISASKLDKIITNGDLDAIKQLAMPKVKPKMTPIKRQRAIAMVNLGYTQKEIADQLGVSLSTLKVSISES